MGGPGWFLHGPHVIPTSLVAPPSLDQEHHFGACGWGSIPPTPFSPG